MIKELRSQHRNIIQLSFNGYSNIEIAERLEMSPCAVSNILRSPLGKAYLEGMHDHIRESTLDVRKKLVELNADALGAFERILNKKTKAPFNVQLSAAKDVLDRNGYKAPDKLTIDMSLQTKTDEEIDKEIAAMEEAIARTQGVTVEQLNNYGSSNLQQSQADPNLNSASDLVDPVFDSANQTSLEDESILENISFDPFKTIGK